MTFPNSPYSLKIVVLNYASDDLDDGFTPDKQLAEPVTAYFSDAYMR